MSTDQREDDPVVGQFPWRVGRKVGRTIYDAHDVLLGVMDTPSLATYVVHAANRAAPRVTTEERPGVQHTEYMRLVPPKADSEGYR